MILDASLLNTQHDKVWIKGKWRNPGKGEALSPTSWYSSYRKVSLQVTLNNVRPTYIYHHHHQYRAGSTDIPDPLSPLLPIVHCPR